MRIEGGGQPSRENRRWLGSEPVRRCNFSPNFFGKHYPGRELNGLAQREVDGRKVLLPVWHGVDERTVRAFSPPLADRVAIRWDNGLHGVSLELLEVVRPDIVQRLQKRAKQLVPLVPIRNGGELANLVAGSQMYQFHNEAVTTQEDSDIIGAFLQELQDWGDIWDGLEAGARAQAELSMHQGLQRIERANWHAYGAQTRRALKFDAQVHELSVALLVLLCQISEFARESARDHF